MSIDRNDPSGPIARIDAFYLPEAKRDLKEALGREPKEDELLPLLAIYLDEALWFVTIPQAKEAAHNAAAIWNGERTKSDELRKRNRRGKPRG